MAPELLNPRDFGLRFVRTTASDIYAFGCVCLEVCTCRRYLTHFDMVQLYTGSPPFTGLSDGAVIHEVVAGGRPEQPAGERTMSDVLWKHISHYWMQNPAARPATGVLVENMIALLTVDTQLRSRIMHTFEHQPSTARPSDDVLIQVRYTSASWSVLESLTAGIPHRFRRQRGTAKRPSKRLRTDFGPCCWCSSISGSISSGA
jgi:serine/threonine protein kinase